MNRLEVYFQRSPQDRIPVGILAERQHVVYFQYDPALLASGMNLSPFRLPFGPALFRHSDLQFGPLPGLFDDSLPDGWGLLLMDRYFASRGSSPAALSPLDRLSWIGDSAMGALCYEPATGKEHGSTVLDLRELYLQSQQILQGKITDVLPQLIRAGGSPGGARPKVSAGIDRKTGTIISGVGDLPEGYEHWILKFSAASDPRWSGNLEYAYALTARAAGILIPETHLFTVPGCRDSFGIKRFDRDGNRRFHMHTFGNLIQSDFRIPSQDYLDLMKAILILTGDHREVLRGIRQMVFNVLMHNRDDHVKNFSFLYDDQQLQWHLSPAYDLMFTKGMRGEHTMSIAGEARLPGFKALLQVAESASVSKKELSSIIEEVSAAVRSFPDFALSSGVPQEEVSRIYSSLRAIRL